ncbi:MAG: GntR family transcriptional regulator [Armatimonadota bacterium]
MALTTGLGKRSEEVLLTLRQEIDQGVYPEGGCLASEHQLCARFGVSRNTIRRAIARLIADEYVEARQGVGAIVRARPQPRPISRTISMMFRDLEVILILQHHALTRNYLLNIYSGIPVDYEPGPERAYLERVRIERPAGLLANLTPSVPTNEDVLATIAAEGTRVIHLDAFRLSPPEESYLIPDYHRAGYLAATQLLLAGYEHLVFVGTQADWPGAKITLQGFADAVNDHLGSYDPARHYYEYPLGASVHEPSRNELTAFLRGIPSNTGFVCRSLDFAAEIMLFLREFGRSIPDELGVLGFDYLEKIFHLTVCDAISFDRIEGMKRALDAIAGIKPYPMREYLPPVVVKRGTVR